MATIKRSPYWNPRLVRKLDVMVACLGSKRGKRAKLGPYRRCAPGHDKRMIREAREAVLRVAK